MIETIQRASEIELDKIHSYDECELIIQQVVQILTRIKLDMEHNERKNDEIWFKKVKRARIEFSAILEALKERSHYLKNKEKNNGQIRFDQIFKGLVRKKLGDLEFQNLILQTEDLYNLSKK